MEFETVSKEKDFLEVKCKGMDEGFANLLVEKLYEQKGVEFAAYSLEHPLTGNPILRVKSSSPKEALVAAAKSIEEEALEAAKLAVSGKK